MKNKSRKLVLLSVLALVFLLSFPLLSFAATGGQLGGVADDQGDTVLTDNNSSTSKTLSSGQTVSWTFASPVHITNVYWEVDQTPYMQFEFYDVNGSQLSTEQPLSGGWLSHDQAGIKKIVVHNFGPAGTNRVLSEVDVKYTVTAPNAPTGLTATAGDGQVTLNWTAAANATSYYVYQNGTQIANPTGTSYTATGLTNGTTYSFTVAATNSGGTSSQTAAATATPADTTPPAVPTGLTAAAGDGQVTLNWTANTDDTVRYQIYKNGVYYNTASGIGTTSFVVTGLTNGTNYSFTITAQDAANNESAQSAAATATPADTTPPAVPTGLTATAGDGQVTLNWTANTDDTVKYLIFKDGVQIGSVNHPTATYKATGLVNGTSYSFTIAAQDGSDNTSAQTAAVTAKPSPPASPGTGITYTGDYGFTATDIFKNAMELVKTLGPFLLLILSVIFAPKLIQLLRAAVAAYRRRRG